MMTKTRTAVARPERRPAAGIRSASDQDPRSDRQTVVVDRVIARAAGGSEVNAFNLDMVERVMGCVCHGPDTEHRDEQVRRKTEATVAAMRAFEPKNEIEAMLASAAVAMHAATMECSRRAMLPNQQPDAASRLRRDAANSARALVEVTEAIERRRGRDPQVVRVERVVVNEGGRAIVGQVTAGTSLLASAQAPAAIAQGAVPMACPDVAPVAMADDREEGE